jgi:hypothetical protein
MKSIFLIGFLSASIFASEKPQDDTYKRIALGTAIVTTWTSIGINEGQKWKQNKTGKIDLFWKDDYHLYRSVTSAGLITVPLLAISLNNKNTKENIKTAIIGNLVGWGIYECMVTSVQGTTLWKPKKNFKILDAEMTLPPPVISLISSVVLSGVIQYSF